MNLTITQKLILLLVVAMLALSMVSVFSLLETGKLKVALDDSINNRTYLLRTLDSTRNAEVAFQMMVQEWKTILIRGKNTEAFEKHLKNFTAHNERLHKQLEIARGAAEKLGIVDHLKINAVIISLDKLAPSYLNALKHYDPYGPDPAGSVDKLVTEIDRAPTQAINEMIVELQKFIHDENNLERKNVDTVYQEGRKGEIIFGVGTMIVLLVMAVYIIYSIQWPISRLEQTISAIANSDDLTRRADSTQCDELGVVAQSFNVMIGKLRNTENHRRNPQREPADHRSLTAALEIVEATGRGVQRSVR